MFKALVFLLIAAVVAAAVGGLHLYRVSNYNHHDLAQYVAPETLERDLGRVLVIFYSLSDHTKEIATQIQDLTKADVFEIKTKNPLKTGPALYLQIKQQLSTEAYPSFVGDLPDLQQYDMIFVGSPVWWDTVSTPVLGLLKKTDFEGKSVVPFATQGSNAGSFFDDFNKSARNATVLKGMEFNKVPPQYNSQVKNKIIHWLNGL